MAVEDTARFGHESLSDVAPVRKGRGELGAQLPRAEVQHSVPPAGGEGFPDPPRSRGTHPRSVFRRAWPNVDSPTRRHAANEGAIEGRLRHRRFTLECGRLSGTSGSPLRKMTSGRWFT